MEDLPGGLVEKLLASGGLPAWLTSTLVTSVILSGLGLRWMRARFDALGHVTGAAGATLEQMQRNIQFLSEQLQDAHRTISELRRELADLHDKWLDAEEKVSRLEHELSDIKRNAAR